MPFQEEIHTKSHNRDIGCLKTIRVFSQFCFCWHIHKMPYKWRILKITVDKDIGDQYLRIARDKFWDTDKRFHCLDFLMQRVLTCFVKVSLSSSLMPSSTTSVGDLDFVTPSSSKACVSMSLLGITINVMFFGIGTHAIITAFVDNGMESDHSQNCENTWTIL